MFCINGGSYLKDSTLKLLNAIGYNTYNGYGMSEIGITSVELRRKPKYRNQNSVGMPFTSVEYRIEEDGTLSVRGSSLCTRKLVGGKEVELTSWFPTGDNMVCKDGHYFILGRLGDVVIGENGENINPDTIESFFSLEGVKGFSVLGLGENEEEELSIVVALGDYVTEEKLGKIKDYIYSVNDTLEKSVAIKKFYFTKDDLCPPTAIKVSRKQLRKKIAEGDVKLTPFSQMKIEKGEGGTSPFLPAVRKIVADALGKKEEEIGADSHVFYDLGATSIQYFDILTRLSKEFSVTNYKQTDKYAYTLNEFCAYLEKHV
jgi:long-subunit acyl-CoA synthetase (AMP-forming)